MVVAGKQSEQIIIMEVGKRKKTREEESLTRVPGVKSSVASSVSNAEGCRVCMGGQADP